MSNIDQRMLRGRTQLIMKHPFFGCLLMHLQLIESPTFRTMATDSKTLWYSRKFLDDNSEIILIFALAHEVMHCALGHCFRRNGREKELWNIACDHVVNLLLKAAGFAVPHFAYCDAQYANLSAEQVYAILYQKRKAEQAQEQQAQKEEQEQSTDDKYNQGNSGSDQEDQDADDADSDNDAGKDSDDTGDADSEDGDDTDGATEDGTETDDEDGDGAAEDDTGADDADGDEGQCGTSSGSSTEQPSTDQETCGDPGGCGEVIDVSESSTEAAEAAEEWQVFTRQAVNVARRMGEGKLPGYLEEVVEALNDPCTDWREQFRRFVEPDSSTKDYTWSIPNRRYTPFGFYTPGTVSDGVRKIAVAIDTSMSVDQEWLALFGAETQAALDNGAVDEIVLIFADTEVRKSETFTKGDIVDFTCVGRGGTAFAPTFQWINEHEPDVACVVYFSDLECVEYGEEPAYPVLWAGHNSDPRQLAFWADRVPWGEVMKLEQ